MTACGCRVLGSVAGATEGLDCTFHLILTSFNFRRPVHLEPSVLDTAGWDQDGNPCSQAVAPGPPWGSPASSSLQSFTMETHTQSHREGTLSATPVCLPRAPRSRFQALSDRSCFTRPWHCCPTPGVDSSSVSSAVHNQDPHRPTLVLVAGSLICSVSLDL